MRNNFDDMDDNNNQDTGHRDSKDQQTDGLTDGQKGGHDNEAGGLDDTTFHDKKKRQWTELRVCCVSEMVG
jgi:hypothetical protein